MPVIEQAKRAVQEAITKRYTCYSYGYNDYDCDRYSRWDSWGRWVLVAALIIGAFFIFLLFSCITARRRRRMGTRPFYGTGWAAGRHGQPQYTNQQPYYGPPQPSVPSNQYNQGYAAPPTYGEAGGYYSGQPKPEQQNGVELQQPNNTYQPPSGPPPGRY